MTYRTSLHRGSTASKDRKPLHYDLLLAIWQAAASEPIGILVKVLEKDKTYWYTQLYRARTYANDQAFFQYKLGYSRFPEESNLQIVHKDADKTRDSAADIPLTGRLLNLDIPDDA